MTQRFGSVARLAQTLGEIGRTRFQLLLLELAEARERLVWIVILSAIGAFALGFALLFLSFLVVVLFWDTARVAACLGVVLGWVVLGVAVLFRAGKLVREARTPLTLTMEQVRTDFETLREALRGDP